MCQCLLVAYAWPLDDLCEGVEDLGGDADGVEEVALAGGVDHLLARVIPAK